MLVILSISLILMLGCTQQTPPVNNITACTADAKLCPDGSAVGRTGPNCEFAPCPQISNDSDAHGCKISTGYSWCESRQTCIRESETSCQMTFTDALVIAKNSNCVVVGNISDVDATYNNNSNTWWLNIQVTRPGCSPACVVYANRTADINWRCTGAIIYTVKTANSSLGEILVNNGGYALYTFTPDTTGISTCYGSCASNWPPLLIVDTISIPHGLPGTMGATIRTDNTTQVTYNGKPIYTYIGDSSPGLTSGQGLSGKWYVIHPSN